MAGKFDKVSGVFEIYCLSTGLSYLGKSNSVGVALRSAKSKLRNNKFHNKSLQTEFNELGTESYEFNIYVDEAGDGLDDANFETQ